VSGLGGREPGSDVLSLAASTTGSRSLRRRSPEERGVAEDLRNQTDASGPFA
jgi:hypothetical protein